MTIALRQAFIAVLASLLMARLSEASSTPGTTGVPLPSMVVFVGALMLAVLLWRRTHRHRRTALQRVKSF